jgi:hypothetical protein
MGDRAEWGGVKSEMGEIVPSGGGNPGILAFKGLGTDKAGWIGDAEGADGSDVKEKRVIDGFRDKAVADFLLKVLGGRYEDGERRAKGDGILVRKERWEAALNQDGMEGAPGLEAGNGEGERGGGDGGGFKPVKCGHGLGVRQGWVIFQEVSELAVFDFEAIQLRHEGEISKVGFGRDYERSVELLDLRGLLKEVEDLIRGEIHEGIVHENGFCVR